MKFIKSFSILLFVLALDLQVWGTDADREHQAQRVCYVSPMEDIAFKKLVTIKLGDEDDKKEIISMLRALSGIDDIQDVTSIETQAATFFKGEKSGEKLGFMDCKCITPNGFYIVEVQVAPETYWNERAAFYAGNAFVKSIRSDRIMNN